MPDVCLGDTEILSVIVTGSIYRYIQGVSEQSELSPCMCLSGRSITIEHVYILADHLTLSIS